MIDTNELKTSFPSISKIEIENYKAGDNFVFYKIIIKFKDGSVLFVNEYTSINDRKYSFHW